MTTARALRAGWAAGSVLAALVPAMAGAQVVKIGLGEALALAERQNPDLAAARADVAAAQSGARAVRRALWPRLGFESGWSRADIPSAAFAYRLDSGEFRAEDFALDNLNDPAAVSHLGTALGIEAPLDVFGKVRAQSSGAEARAQSADAAVGEGLLDLRLHVVEAYRRAALAQAAVSVTERALASARAREADVEAAVAAGGALQADLLRSRARRRERAADLAARKADADVAIAALARLLGAPPGSSYMPNEPAVGAPPPLQGDLQAWIGRGLEHRPLLAEARAGAEAARWAVKGEGRSVLPDLALWGQVRDDRLTSSGGKQSTALGLSLRWSAFDPSRSSRRDAAEASARAADERQRGAADQVRLEVETAFRRAEAARERCGAAAGGAEEGREALRVVRERRQAGMATLTDELETETASLGAELEELRASTEAAIADAALARAAGELGGTAGLPAATEGGSKQ